MKTSIEFKKILIAVDASEYSQKAAKYGMQLAKKLDAEVTLIHIDEFPITANIAGDPIMGDPIMVLPELVSIQKNNANTLLKQIISDFGTGIKVTQTIKTGEIKEEILETAKTWRPI